MDRTEHLQWSKNRAQELCDDGDFQGAYTSMVSDLGKEYEVQTITESPLRTHAGLDLGHMLFAGRMLDSPREMTNWIQGFN